MASSGGYRVLLVLPPDFQAPPSHRPFRFPHQGPALVAASVAPDGITCIAADLDLDLDSRPLKSNAAVLEDEARFNRHFSEKPEEELVSLARELVDRIDDTDVDAFAFSIDRHTQVNVSLLLAVELKRRFGRPVLIGGANAGAVGQKAQPLQVRGLDLITTSESPAEIRSAFAALRGTPSGRWEFPHEPVATDLDTPPDEWPLPDFSIYDLNRYRRDPFIPRGSTPLERYDRSMGSHLMLPYHFSWDCQYACTFCARGGTQTVKSPRKAARDLATLAERYGTGDFMFFDAQINLFAEEFSRELIAINAGIHWTDSFRVAPRRPKDVLETMARAGCVGLTFGVESASDRILKRMVKGHTAAQATAVVRDAHALDMFVRVNLLPCFPSETPADLAETERWTEEQAPYIDEVVPSSFYMASNSPILEKPERYGVQVRGARAVDGEYKFRKNHGSLTYDEIGGYSWEEREATLRPAEELLRKAWARGRTTPPLFQPTQIFALRRRWKTKSECYDALVRWGGQRPGQMQGPAEGVGASEYSPDRIEPQAIDSDSARARALTAATQTTSDLKLVLHPQPADRATLSFKLEDDAGGALNVHLERVRVDGRYFQKGARLGLWYSRDTKNQGGEPGWTGKVLKALAAKLLTDDALADELQPRTTTALPIAQPSQPQRFPQYSVFDLVLKGVKPAGSLLIPSESAIPEVVKKLPFQRISSFGFTRDAQDNLRFHPSPPPGTGARMLYAGQENDILRRLEELERGLYRNQAQLSETQEEIGKLLGFPDCCARSFAHGVRQSTNKSGDLYTSLQRPGWSEGLIDWRVNHVIAKQYALPILIHDPCTPSCEATRKGTERALEALYTPQQRTVIGELLRLGAVVFPDDRVVLFEVAGEQADGTVRVRHFNRAPHLYVLGFDRPAERCVAADAGGVLDSSVRSLRLGANGLEVETSSGWAPYRPAGTSQLTAPKIVVPRADVGSATTPGVSVSPAA